RRIGATYFTAEAAWRSELDQRLREQPALGQLRRRRLKHLLHRHDDPEPTGSDLTPVRAAEDVAMLRQSVIGNVRLDEVDAAHARPASGALTSFTEKRQPAALDVYSHERVVGGGKILRGGHHVRRLVAPHENGDVARPILRIPAVLVEGRDVQVAELALR